MFAIQKKKSVVLSEQQLVDCDSNNEGCNILSNKFRYVKDEGVVSQAEYPYVAEEHDQCLLSEGSYKINDFKEIDGDEEVMADFVFTNGPLSLFLYKSGVFDPSAEDCQQHSVGSHAVAIVGYGTLDGKKYWLIKNSWGNK
uniref:Pept_C1 domain-containing protein n=1 Tax=Syphacia muris TaxID=451379 RepID=A0A0N5AE22_9BILA